MDSLSFESNEDIENALEQVNNILKDTAGVRLKIGVCRKAKHRLSKKVNKPCFADDLVILVHRNIFQAKKKIQIRGWLRKRENIPIFLLTIM